MGASTSLFKHRREDKHKEWRKDFCCRQVQRTFFEADICLLRVPNPLVRVPNPLAHWCHSGETQRTRTATSPFSTTSSSLRFYVQSTSHWQYINVKGKENPFVLSRVYDVDWICEYDMAWYPFDTQSCGMVFEVGGSIQNPQSWQNFWQILTKRIFLSQAETPGSLSSWWCLAWSTLAPKISPSTLLGFHHQYQQYQH